MRAGRILARLQRSYEGARTQSSLAGEAGLRAEDLSGSGDGVPGGGPGPSVAVRQVPATPGGGTIVDGPGGGWPTSGYAV